MITTWSEFPNGGKAILGLILGPEERNKSTKSRTVGITVWDSSRKVNHLSKVAWNKKNYNRVHQIYHQSCTGIGKPVRLMDIKVSKYKNISRWVDQENLIYVGWKRIKKSCTKRKKLINRGKRSKTEWSKVSWKHN